MSRIGTFTQLKTVSASNIMYAISIDDLTQLKKLINEANVNNVIDTKNLFTALHHAIRMNNESMVNWLLDMGANPSLKTITGDDAIDLSIKFQSNTAINHLLNDKNDTISVLKSSVSNLEKKTRNLESTNDHLSKSFLKVSDDKSRLSTENSTLNKTISRHEVTISSLREDNHRLDGEVKSLKRKYDTLSEEHANLNKSFTTLLKASKR